MNVYIIESEGGMCKIGKANDPPARMASLSTGVGEFIYRNDGDCEIIYEVHSVYFPFATDGETMVRVKRL